MGVAALVLAAAASPSLAAKDRDAPSLEVLVPDRTTVSGKIAIEAKASDRSSGISRVVFKVDGKERWVERRKPFRFGGDRGYWTTGLESNGEHVIRVTAVDASGRKSSRKVVLSVDNRGIASGGMGADAVSWVGADAGSTPGAPSTAGAAGVSGSSGAWVPGRRPFNDRSPFNSAIPSGAPLAPLSSSHVAGLVQHDQVTDLLLSIGAYGVPVYYADASTPRTDVQNTRGWWGYEVVKGVPVPPGATGDQASDGHIAIIDTDTGCVYEGWQFERQGGGYAASSFGVLPGGVNGQGVFPGGASMTASGFSLLAGLVFPHELERGHIDHALTYAVPSRYVASGGPVAPATFSTGTGTSTLAAPMGARVQLDPSFDVNSLANPHERTIARALQEHGMYLRDLGGAIGIFAMDKQSVPAGTYESMGIRGDYLALPNIPMDRMRVIEYGSQDPSRDRGASYASDPGICATYV